MHLDINIPCVVLDRPLTAFITGKSVPKS
uniref:RHD3 n=1 Tax=Arundo donax TaxID=35708 RepID=A0A0A9AME1_ARUDO